MGFNSCIISLFFHRLIVCLGMPVEVATVATDAPVISIPSAAALTRAL